MRNCVSSETGNIIRLWDLRSSGQRIMAVSYRRLDPIFNYPSIPQNTPEERISHLRGWSVKSRIWRSLRSKTRGLCQFVCDLIHNKTKTVALIFESYVSVFCQIYWSVTIFSHVDPIKPGLHKVWCVLGSWRSTVRDRSIKTERMWGQLVCQKHVVYTNGKTVPQ